jgi:polyisoprenyl-teichoic acid--peptidoglycan teichoic acid transferase
VGVLAVAVLVVVVLSVTGGSSGTSSATQPSTTSSVTTAHKHSKSQTRHTSSEASAPAASPAETSVAVLNGTQTAGLAHTISGNLRQSGYTQAIALNGQPPGETRTTVVEYTHGHRADAAGVARTLSVTHVQPMESTAASLSGSATVVVIVGLDKAAAVQ